MKETLGEESLCNAGSACSGIGEPGSSGEAGQGDGRYHLCICMDVCRCAHRQSHADECSRPCTARIRVYEERNTLL